ncbi:helix-turn-helix transcriptional regulator [Clostridium boliviensis]|uniref:Helix-turn-helix transcriptional regulator n=1 Tax=Clostridium boliviensis TaxID=318465 RepID=A0ABU4GI79_9CLOT|nr:helix-turn-helix transcriptional regulator [Clostridium boliviensis]MDW2797314.1 helix-turn-helix transcriptional regulator [Clostridium boliviensis]
MPLNIVIREKRKETGLTQEEIADYLGVSAPAVSKWEKACSAKRLWMSFTAKDLKQVYS